MPGRSHGYGTFGVLAAGAGAVVVGAVAYAAFVRRPVRDDGACAAPAAAPQGSDACAGAAQQHGSPEAPAGKEAPTAEAAACSGAGASASCAHNSKAGSSAAGPSRAEEAAPAPPPDGRCEPPSTHAGPDAAGAAGGGDQVPPEQTPPHTTPLQQSRPQPLAPNEGNGEAGSGHSGRTAATATAAAPLDGAPCSSSSSTGPAAGAGAGPPAERSPQLPPPAPAPEPLAAEVPSPQEPAAAASPGSPPPPAATATPLLRSRRGSADFAGRSDELIDGSFQGLRPTRGSGPGAAGPGSGPDTPGAGAVAAAAAALRRSFNTARVPQPLQTACPASPLAVVLQAQYTRRGPALLATAAGAASSVAQVRRQRAGCLRCNCSRQSPLQTALPGHPQTPPPPTTPAGCHGGLLHSPCTSASRCWQSASVISSWQVPAAPHCTRVADRPACASLLAHACCRQWHRQLQRLASLPRPECMLAIMPHSVAISKLMLSSPHPAGPPTHSARPPAPVLLRTSLASSASPPRWTSAAWRAR